MPKASKILVIRFSAMGDVAMAASVLKEFVQHYPAVEILVTSRLLFKPFFNNIDQLDFYPFDPLEKHKGFFGLIKLFSELKTQNITAVADLHHNLRSKILTLLFFLAGVKTVSVDKGRKEKSQLTRKYHKILKPLKLTVERYADVFRKLGFPFQLTGQLPAREMQLPPRAQKWIGVSPFAKHSQKIYPLHKMESVLLQLAKLNYKLFIFGGSEEEKRIAENWAAQHTNIASLIKKITLEEELELISQLDLMISMDSSGMHLASLKGVPVVSIWGSTHPYAGFLGYGQSINDAVQIDLYCRPCSIYGNIPCYRGDFACMNNLTETVVINKILEKLGNG